MMQQFPEISIVIPAHNCMHTLPQVIEKLLEQSQFASGMEIIVIDDGSTDGTRDWLAEKAAKYHAQFKFLVQQNQGPACARNRGIEVATGSIIFFLDADVIPSDELLPAHLTFHREHPENHLALRGNTIDLNSPEFKNGVWCRPSVASFKTRPLDKKNLPWVEFLSGNISLKRSFLIENRLRFNERLFVGEDVELGFKAQQLGLILHFSETAIGYHRHPITLRSHLNKGTLAGKSYATWYAAFPELKTELEKLGIEHYYGFIGRHRPWFWKFKQFSKRVIANSATYPIFYCLANLKAVRNNKGLYWIVRQAYEIKFRSAFRKEFQALKRKQSLEQPIR